MQKDLPYSALKRDERAYEIMLLRDQHGNTFTDIAKEYGVSVARALQKYNKIKITQMRLYINHISMVLGHEDIEQVKKVYFDAFEWYQDRSYACAYLENKYKKILDEYRGGEPGMPLQFLESMPPYKRKLSKKAIARVIEMREVEKASYLAIAKELRMTQAKAKHTYEWFYHEQVLERIKVLEEKAGSFEERMAIRDYYFKRIKSSKKRYDMLMEK